MRGLNDKDRSYLFTAAIKAKSQGESLSSVFMRVAKRTGRASGSVRNFFYKSIQAGECNFAVRSSVPFTSEEESRLIRSVLKERQTVGSMRRAINNVAGGDPVLALRYRNKFSNLLKKQRANIMREVIIQKAKTGKCFNPYLCTKNRSARVKLKNEIDALIKAIGEKCEKENALLKKKITEYNRLPSMPSESDNVFCSGKTAKQYFNKNASLIHECNERKNSG